MWILCASEATKTSHVAVDHRASYGARLWIVALEMMVHSLRKDFVETLRRCGRAVVGFGEVDSCSGWSVFCVEIQW